MLVSLNLEDNSKFGIDLDSELELENVFDAKLT